MKKYTTLLLGSAAAMLVATSGAQAADPIFDIVDPREPVYRCDITGFIELPGTDICFKVGGFAKHTTMVTSKDWADGRHHTTTWGMLPDPNVNIHLDDSALIDEIQYLPFNDQFRMGVTGRLNFDARTATEYGTVRAFIEMQAQGIGGVSFNLRHAYVQFGNWTFGQTWTAFHGPGLAPTSFAFSHLHDGTFRAPQIRYTQPFGNGFSATLAIEDASHQRDDVKKHFPHLNFFAEEVDFGDGTFAESTHFFPWEADEAVGHDRRRAPNIVANIGAEGAWGSAQLGGVLVFQRLAANVGFDDGGVITADTVGAGTKTGWGVNFGAAINVPTTPGSQVLFHTTYTDGASEYNAGTNQSLVWGGGTADGGPFGFNECRSVEEDKAPFFVADEFHHCGIRDTVQIWTIGAAYRHVFSPTMAFAFGGAYGEIDFGSGTGVSGFYGGPGDHTLVIHSLKRKAYEVFANISWTPVANTEFLLEGRWGRVDSGYDLFVEGVNERVYHLGGKNDAFAIGFDVTRSF